MGDRSKTTRNKGFNHQLNNAAHSIDLYYGENLITGFPLTVHEWNDLENSSWRREKFVANKLKQLFDLLDREEE